MIKIFIQGLNDGEYPIEQIELVDNVPGLCEEFFADIRLVGKLRILGKRFSFTGSVECKAKLICDLSLIEYEQNITGDIKVSFIADSTLARMKEKSNVANAETNIISEDDKYLDLTDEIRELLIVNLPMKRIAPEYSDKSFKDIYPEYSSKNENKIENEINSIWLPLKKLSNNDEIQN